MNESSINKKVPVLVLAFNRADHVTEAMKAIREYKPDRIYLECDGPRIQKEGEQVAVETTRKVMIAAIDWKCEVNTLFRKDNLGCANAVYEAISWFLENEEWGIIIEDDVIVGEDFFRLCEELLPRYKDEEKIMEISAQNLFAQANQRNTYIYTNDFHCWGWATWSRAWKKMDMEMKKWQTISWWKLIRTFDCFRGSMMYYYWNNTYRHIDTSTSWATRWYFSIIVNGCLVIQPGVNLAINIGMDGGAHYEKNDKNPYAYLKIDNIQWPLEYNDSIAIDPGRTELANKDFKRIRWIGAKKKIRKLLHI